MHRFRFALLAALAGCFIGSAQADTRPVDCELTVRGRTYIKGVCQFRSMSGGSFQIHGDDHFAYVNISAPGVAEASWNAEPSSTHAHDPLGTVRRSGACWVGPDARICARALSPAAERATIAAQPSGQGLFPEMASQACLGLEGGLAPGARLVLRNCRLPADLIFARGADGSLGLSGRPELCLGAGQATAGRPQATIAPCASNAVRWSMPASDAAQVRSSAGTCLTVPQMQDADARFPFPVHVEPCATAGEAAVRFFLSRG